MRLFTVTEKVNANGEVVFQKQKKEWKIYKILRPEKVTEEEYFENINRKNKEKLLRELNQVIREMNRVIVNLDHVTETDLIDCLIFELNATQIRYKFILNKLRALIPEKEEKNDIYSSNNNLEIVTNNNLRIVSNDISNSISNLEEDSMPIITKSVQHLDSVKEQSE